MRTDRNTYGRWPRPRPLSVAARRMFRKLLLVRVCGAAGGRKGVADLSFSVELGVTLNAVRAPFTKRSQTDSLNVTHMRSRIVHKQLFTNRVVFLLNTA